MGISCTETAKKVDEPVQSAGPSMKSGATQNRYTSDRATFIMLVKPVRRCSEVVFSPVRM